MRFTSSPQVTSGGLALVAVTHLAQTAPLAEEESRILALVTDEPAKVAVHIQARLVETHAAGSAACAV